MRDVRTEHELLQHYKKYKSHSCLPGRRGDHVGFKGRARANLHIQIYIRYISSENVLLCLLAFVEMPHRVMYS